jgi:Domain of unknown function (DUF1992)
MSIKSENKLRIVEDEIGRHLTEAAKNGELQSAKSYGKPLDFGDGYEETPDELRMGFKMLKDSGFVPPEVEMMRQIQIKRERLHAAVPDSLESTTLKKQINELETGLEIAKARMRG